MTTWGVHPVSAWMSRPSEVTWLRATSSLSGHGPAGLLAPGGRLGGRRTSSAACSLSACWLAFFSTVAAASGVRPICPSQRELHLLLAGDDISVLKQVHEHVLVGRVAQTSFTFSCDALGRPSRAAKVGSSCTYLALSVRPARYPGMT